MVRTTMKRETIQDSQDILMTSSISNLDDSGYDSCSQDRARSATPTAIDDLGRDSRKLVDAIQSLTSLGIDTSDLPLPKLVVVGDQSSGKSSLIEAISEIKVPRASGKCTACVLRINLRFSKQASWSLRLVQDYFYDKKAVQRGKDDFPGWTKLQKPSILAQYDLQYDDIELYLRRAQEALISPGMDPIAILEGRQQGDQSAKFSPNTIELEVHGPTIPDLNLYDLPGLTSQDDQDANFPDLVQRLARKYISGKNTIIVLACPMNVDPETLIAASKVRGEWNARARTIGVLTKPDTASPGDDLQRWSSILSGEKFPVGKGYFVTLQPGPLELKAGITHEGARQNEAKFFGNAPWSTYFSSHQGRFGTGALQKQLSALLSEEIATCLPGIRANLHARLATIQEQSKQFPPPPPSPYGTIIHIVEKARAEIDAILTGDMPGYNELVREWRGYAEELLADLKKLQPLVIVNTGPEVQWQSSGQVISLDDSDDEHEHIVPIMTPVAGSKRAGSVLSQQESPTKKQRTRATPSTSPSQHAARFSLDDIKQKIAETTTSGVPSDTDPRAEDRMIQDSVKSWETPMRSYLSAVHGATERHLLRICVEHTQKWRDTALPKTFEDTVRNCFDQIYETHEHACIRALRAEQTKPFTCNSDGLKQQRQAQLASLREHRQNARKRAYVTWQEKSANKPVSDPVVRDSKAKNVKDKDIGDDPRDPEIQVMARIRGYYNLAAATLADTVAKKTQFEVFEQLRESLEAALPRGLGIDGDDAENTANSRRLLVEDAAREEKRQELEGERIKVEEALSLLIDARLR